jgi:DNA helicase-2/ATP-dependent DNA helicase PcrA
MSVSSEMEIEEERRLFYVALTRARKNVFLSHSAIRFRWGSMTPSAPSRFLNDIDSRYLDYGAKPFTNFPTPKQQKPLFVENKYKTSITPTFPSNFKPLNAPSNPQNVSSSAPTDWGTGDDPSKIKAGMTVEHFRLGLGKILDVEGSKAKVDFGNNGQKQLILKFAKLKIVR